MIDRNHPRHKNSAMLQPAVTRGDADLEKRRQQEMTKAHKNNHKAQPKPKKD